MSNKTRRASRRQIREAPIENDWLWSCSIGMRTRDIASALGFTTEQRFEFSARSRDDEMRFRDDMYHTLVPDLPLKPPFRECLSFYFNPIPVLCQIHQRIGVGLK